MYHSHNRRNVSIGRGHLMMSVVAPAMLLAQLNLAQNTEPDGDKRIALYAKPAVVRIATFCIGEYSYYNYRNTYEWPDSLVIKGSNIGSGFFINPDGYIATNANVTKLFKEIKTEQVCQARLLDELVKQVNREQKKKLSREDIQENIQQERFYYKHHVILPNGDKYPFEIKEFPTFLANDFAEGGKDVSIVKIEVEKAPALKLGDSREVQIQDPVITLGYPFIADINSSVLTKNIFFDEKLDDKSANEASVTTGQVANPNKTLPNGSPVLQIDVSVSKGSSGGPVVNKKGEVIGMVTYQGEEGEERENLDNIPFAVTASTIKEFIGQAGTINEPGVVDELYRTGLKLYWQEDYLQAKAKFEAVKGLFRQHSEVDRLIGECDQRIAENWWKNNNLLWLWGIGAIAGGPLLVYLLLKRRSSGASQQPLNQPMRQPKQRLLSNIVTSVFRNSKTVGVAQPFLELKNQQGQTLRLYLEKERHQLGRDRDWSDVEIPDLGWEVISRHHAVLDKEGENYRIYDGDGNKPTTNGIFINRNRIDTKGQLLNNGDKLEIGQDPHNKVELIYYNPASNSSPITSGKAVQA